MSSVFDVLAEPKRRAILDLLLVRDHSVGDLVARVGLAQPTVSKHLRVMREAGLVAARVAGQRRVYRVDTAPLREVDDWLEPYRRRWRDSLDALEQHLDSLPTDDAADHPDEETP